MRCSFDDRDGEILAYREAEFNRREGPRVGDAVKMPDGTVRRFNHDWGDDIQTTKGPGWDASFYLGKGGYAEFSGSLDHAIPKSKLTLTGETLDAPFWFFHHGEVGAHRGVHFHMKVRVFVYNP